MLEVEHVFDDYDGAASQFVGLLVGIAFFALRLAQFRHADANAKLLAAVGALKDERLSRFIVGVVEDGELVAFGASYAFHSRKCLE